mgnify:FL=1
MTIYRGGVGMWSFILHRVPGIGVLLFLLIHIIDTVLIGWGPEIYNKVMALYAHPVFRVSEVGLFGAVLFHAMNGIRIIIIDFWEKSSKYHKQMFYAEIVLFAVSFAGAAFVMLKPLFGGA